MGIFRPSGSVCASYLSPLPFSILPFSILRYSILHCSIWRYSATQLLVFLLVLSGIAFAAKAGSNDTQKSTPLDQVVIELTKAIAPYPEISDQPLRKVSLTEEQTMAYWKYCQHWVAQRQYGKVKPVLSLLASADGVSPEIRGTAKSVLGTLNRINSVNTPTDEPYPSSDVALSLVLGGEKNYNRRFDGVLGDGSTYTGTELNLAYLYELNSTFSSYLELDAIWEPEIDEGVRFFDKPDIDRVSTWLNMNFSNEVLSKDFTIGTQSVVADNTWWWDDTLDLAALYVSNDNWSMISAVGIETVDQLFGETIESDEKHIARLFGDYRWHYHDNHSVALLFLGLYDYSDQYGVGDSVKFSKSDFVDQKINWFGLSSNGTINSNSWPINYWLDIARVSGQEVGYYYQELDEQTIEISDKETIDVNGWGLSSSASIDTALPGKPEIRVGFATTSADNDVLNSSDETFWQTGHHTNDFGIVLDPELSNLSVLNMGVTFDVSSKATIALNYYHFKQVVAADYLRNSNLDIEWSGENTRIGSELDVELAFSLWDDVDVSLSYGIFEAGEAAPEQQGSTVNFGSIELTYDFL